MFSFSLRLLTEEAGYGEVSQAAAFPDPAAYFTVYVGKAEHSGEFLAIHDEKRIVLEHDEPVKGDVQGFILADDLMGLGRLQKILHLNVLGSRTQVVQGLGPEGGLVAHGLNDIVEILHTGAGILVHQSLVVGLEAAHDIKRREFSDHLVLAVRNQQDALFAFSGQIFLLLLNLYHLHSFF